MRDTVLQALVGLTSTPLKWFDYVDHSMSSAMTYGLSVVGLGDKARRGTSSDMVPKSPMSARWRWWSPTSWVSGRAAKQDDMEAAILITGCSSGIGQELALHFWMTGYTVFATVRRQQDADWLVHFVRRVAELDKRFDVDRFIVLQMDVTKADTIRHAVERIEAWQRMLRTSGDVSSHCTRHLVAIVNSAGVFTVTPLEYAPQGELVNTFETNLFGPLAMTRAFLPLLKQCPGGGRVVNIGSMASFFALPGTGLYNATKAGLASISDVLRLEMSKYGIRVSLIEPGGTRTPAFHKTMDALKQSLLDDTIVGVNSTRHLSTISSGGGSGSSETTGHYVRSTGSASSSPDTAVENAFANESMDYGKQSNVLSSHGLHVRNMAGDVETRQETIRNMKHSYLRLLDWIYSASFPIDHVVQAVEHAVTASHPKDRYLVGWDARLAHWATAMVPTVIMDRFKLAIAGF